MMLENEQRLRCDWNSTFCVTDLSFNESVFTSEKMRNYFLGNKSVRQEIEKLHFNIESTFPQRFPEITDTDIVQQIAEKLEGLDPKAWIHSLSHTAGGMGIVVIVMGLYYAYCFIYCSLSLISQA